MSSRGSVVKKGVISTDEYKTVEVFDNAKIIEGIGKNHSMPDYSHSKEAIYIIEDKNGEFKQMRFYNSNHESVLEIAYEPEPKLSSTGRDRQSKILHYHVISPNGGKFDRSNPIALNKDSNVYKMASKYLRRYNL